MRWSPPSDRVQLVLLSPIIVPITVAALPFVALMVASIKVSEWWKRAFGPSWEWSDWYAWRPVRINDWFDEDSTNRWVWLETIRRRRHRYGDLEYSTQTEPRT